MRKVLIAYDTLSGATGDIAETIRNELVENGCIVELGLVDNVRTSEPVNAVVIGSPIRFGECSPKVRRFVANNQSLLTRVPTAFYFTCLSAVELIDKPLPKMPIYVDPAFGARAGMRNEFGLFGYLHSVYYYVERFMKAVSNVRPVATAFFKGRLDYAKLRLHQRIIMKLVCLCYGDIRQGEFVNRDAARAWATMLCVKLNLTSS